MIVALRYAQIEAIEDFGLGLALADGTDDFVGANQKDDPAPAATGDEVDVQIPVKK